MFSFQSLPQVTSAREALPGRDKPSFSAPTHHEVLDVAATDEWPAGTRTLYVGMGCFWGAERIFWELPGVVTTAVGYMGGFTPNPEYFEVCTGQTGHTEAVLVAYDPKRISTEEILRAFWENHDSTTLNRQGNDVGSQYRSALYWTTEEQRETIDITHRAYQEALTAAGHGTITTEVRPAGDAGPFYFAEQDHQQYLELRPWGYCNHGFNGVACQTGLTTAS